MHLKKLSLTNFRSYENLELTFTPGVNTFIGDNGCGKTNIAEALIYLGFLSSHRVSTNAPPSTTIGLGPVVGGTPL